LGQAIVNEAVDFLLVTFPTFTEKAKRILYAKYCFESWNCNVITYSI